MQSLKILDKANTVAQIYVYTEYAQAKSREELIFSLSKDIKNSSVGYAGFSKKEYLEQALKGFVFDQYDANKTIPRLQFDQRKIVKIVGQSIKDCHNILPSKPTRIFIFPTFSAFVKNKMSGVLGYTPYQNTILVFINPLNKRWPLALADAIAHEFHHAVFLRFHTNKRLLDIFVFEGLAEHFREYARNNEERAPWANVFSVSQSRKILLELKKYWNLKKYYPLYQSIFFGDTTYPRWAGYTIGYHIVQSFLKYNPDITWTDIIKLSPQKIFERSKFL